MDVSTTVLISNNMCLPFKRGEGKIRETNIFNKHQYLDTSKTITHLLTIYFVHTLEKLKVFKKKKKEKFFT